MKHTIKSITLFVLFMALPLFIDLSFAPPFDPPSGAVPLDGGLSLLAAAGLGYAGKKLWDNKKKKKQE